MYTKEQKILRFSMILLFLALMIVYIIWYQVKGSEVKKSLLVQNSGSTVQTTSISGNIPTISPVNSTKDDMLSIEESGNSLTGNIYRTGIIVSDTKIMTGTTKQNSDIKLLSGTSIYYGKIAVIEKLGIKYQYALADEKGIWYIYLGTPSYDFANIARALQGNLYTLTTEQDLIQNKLFGNKVVFINLPEYKNKQVLMLVYLDDGIWLIQVEYALYHKSKAYIKSLFID